MSVATYIPVRPVTRLAHEKHQAIRAHLINTFSQRGQTVFVMGEVKQNPYPFVFEEVTPARVVVLITLKRR